MLNSMKLSELGKTRVSRLYVTMGAVLLVVLLAIAE